MRSAPTTRSGAGQAGELGPQFPTQGRDGFFAELPLGAFLGEDTGEAFDQSEVGKSDEPSGVVDDHRGRSGLRPFGCL